VNSYTPRGQHEEEGGHEARTLSHGSEGAGCEAFDRTRFSSRQRSLFPPISFQLVRPSMSQGQSGLRAEPIPKTPCLNLVLPSRGRRMTGEPIEPFTPPLNEKPT